MAVNSLLLSNKYTNTNSSLALGSEVTCVVVTSSPQGFNKGRFVTYIQIHLLFMMSDIT